jgi:hypothetical protein
MRNFLSHRYQGSHIGGRGVMAIPEQPDRAGQDRARLGAHRRLVGATQMKSSGAVQLFDCAAAWSCDWNSVPGAIERDISIHHVRRLATPG